MPNQKENKLPRRRPHSLLLFLFFLFSCYLSACGGGGGSSATANLLNSTPATTDVSDGSETSSDSRPQPQPQSESQSPTESTYGISLFAGHVSEGGYADGSAAAARFLDIQSYTSDAAGNLYVADSGTIRMITSSGQVTTLAGAWQQYGHADGMGAAARFGANKGSAMNLKVAADVAGNVYVADAPYIRKITPQGNVTTIAGAAEAGTTDGPIAAARFSAALNGIAVDLSGNLFVDEGGYLVEPDRVRKISTDGMVSTVHQCRFPHSCGNIRVDPAGNLYVQDDYVAQSAGEARFSDSAHIYRIGPDGITSPAPGIPTGMNRYLKITLADIDRNGNLYWYESHMTYHSLYDSTSATSEYYLRELTPAGGTQTMEPFSYVLLEDKDAGYVNRSSQAALFPLRHPLIAVMGNGDIYFFGKTFIGKLPKAHIQ